MSESDKIHHYNQNKNFSKQKQTYKSEKNVQNLIIKFNRFLKMLLKGFVKNYISSAIGAGKICLK